MNKDFTGKYPSGYIETLKEARAKLIEKMETNYQRGDASELSDLNMFIAIFEETKDVKDQEESDKICAKHGFFITREKK